LIFSAALCDVLGFFLCGFRRQVTGKTAEDAEDFAENAEKNSNEMTSILFIQFSAL